MTKAADALAASARYYANPHEQKILIQGLHRYFSLPERSGSRNQIAKDVSNFLRLYSPHWTHRAVRLWFNNNRHTYLALSPAAIEPYAFLPDAPVAPARLPPAFAACAPALAFAAPAAEPAPGAACPALAQLFADIRRLPAGDARLAPLAAGLDSACADAVARFGALSPEWIEPQLRYLPLPLPRDADFRFPADPFWQVRQFQDTAIVNFECGVISEELAAFTNPATVASQSTVTVWPYRRASPDFTTIGVESIGPVCAICITSDATWLLSKTTVLIVPSNRFEAPRAVPLPFAGPAAAAAVEGGGIVVGFPGVPALAFVNEGGVVRKAQLPFRGIAAMARVGNRLVCAASGSSVVRVLSNEAREISWGFGHLGAVDRVERITDETFVSQGRDNTLRIWKVEQMAPIATVLLGRVEMTAAAGSENFMVCGFQNKTVIAIDLRKGGGFVMGITTQEFVPIRLLYDSRNDALFLFGTIEPEAQVLFADNERQGKQSVFRQYPNFLARDATKGLF